MEVFFIMDNSKFVELLKGVRFSWCGVLGGKNDFNHQHKITVEGWGGKCHFDVAPEIFAVYPGDGLPVKIEGRLSRRSGATSVSMKVTKVIYNSMPNFVSPSPEEIMRGCFFEGYCLLLEKRSNTREGVVYNSLFLETVGDVLKVTDFADDVFFRVPEVKANDRLFVKISGTCRNSISYSVQYNSHNAVFVPFIESLLVEGSVPVGSKFSLGVGNSNNSASVPDPLPLPKKSAA
jgi:hypothetical protein